MAEKTKLWVDIETYSSVDIKHGVYRYVEAPDFMILFAWWFYEGEWHFSEGEGLTELDDLLRDPSVVKVAHNAPFERVCFSRYLGMPTGEYLPPEQWRDTAVLASENGLPRSLKSMALAMGIEQKDEAGTRLIKKFCVPNKDGKRTMPEEAPEDWARFVEYGKQDVVVLMDADDKLRWPTKTERVLSYADQRINDAGIPVDPDLVEWCIAADEQMRGEEMAELKALTGLDNPNSVQQLTGWLAEHGCDTDDLRKETVGKLLESGELTPLVRRVLELRLDLALVTAKKYYAARDGMCADNRLRGQFRFFGAHSGRWSGSGVQLQNLSHDSFRTDAETDAAVMDLQLGLGADHQTLKALVRSMLIGPFTVCDYSAIEARVIAWLAGEQWALDAFAQGRDIYVETANRMGHGMTRQDGKQAVLGLGYGGGVNALKTMARGRDIGTDESLQKLVTLWRETNPNIVRFWYELGDAFKSGGRVGKHLRVEARGGVRRMVLPSGRALTYRGVTMIDGERGPSLAFTSPRNGIKTRTWGGTLAENCWAGDTLVLARRGWVPIRFVTLDDLLWDGQEWVRHRGVIGNGVQKTVRFEGTSVTPEHRIFSREKGWVQVVHSEGLHRADVRLPDGAAPCAVSARWAKAQGILGMFLRLREYGRENGNGYGAGQNRQVVRMQDERNDRCVAADARHDSAPRLCSVAFDESAVRQSHASRMEKLWGARNLSMRRMARFVYRVLARYGAHLPARPRLGPARQQPRVLPGELSLGGQTRQHQQPPCVPVYGHTAGADDGVSSFARVWDWGDDNPLPFGPRVGRVFGPITPGREEQVYDIRDCGPRHRYVVLTGRGPVLAHNCTQAVARDVLGDAILGLQAEGHAVVGHVHDEVLVEGVDLEGVRRVMCIPPSWADGLPINAEGYVCSRYRKG